MTLPGDTQPTPVEDALIIPQGSVVDTRGGKARLTVETPIPLEAAGASKLESSLWSEGVFRIVQLRSGVTECRLRGPLVTTAAAKRRRLWGDGGGKFRTKGRFGSATVRGTKWLTEDRRGLTFFLVRRGSVKVRDFVRHKTVILTKGERYTVRKRKTR